MSGAVRLRLAVPSDIETVAALTTQAYRPYTELFGYPPVPVTEDYGPRIAADEVWLLLEKDVAAGVLVLEKHPDHAMIFSVAIADGFQKKGYGLKLLDWSAQQTREAGLRRLRLYTNARMERNIALYLRYGFTETGRRENPKRPGWIIVDMEKGLD